MELEISFPCSQEAIGSLKCYLCNIYHYIVILYVCAFNLVINSNRKMLVSKTSISKQLFCIETKFYSLNINLHNLFPLLRPTTSEASNYENFSLNSKNLSQIQLFLEY